MKHHSGTKGTNPYSPPEMTLRYLPSLNGIPRYCFAVFVVSLVLSCLHAPVLLLDLLELNMGYEAALKPTIIPGWVSTSGIVFFGSIGNFLLLRRSRWGFLFAGCLVLSVAASIGVGIWITLISRSLPQYRVTPLNDLLCVSMPLIRSLLLVLYASAVVVFYRWWSRISRRSGAAH